MNLKQWFNKGMTYEQYQQHMQVNKDEMLSIYERFTIDESLQQDIKKMSMKQIDVIVITEDWCGDALVNIPILMKIAAETNMKVRFILRDENLELMDQYLTNGTARAIPIFIFIDSNGNEQAVWGPRADYIQQIVDAERNKLPAKESSDYKERQDEMIKNLKERYMEDEQLWNIISQSIFSRLL
ncbi:thioredoxin family protein [Metabacillus malikii]|uniref:Thioredoxin n=1 Tax=Metabacillus malikii TaxID=1504265 RepID=A0ABT9ZG28_9BACI|nr:thioredoxin family protein [Metabacillus malikii]MDQ0231236.1 hypothetical protein [Metabacillus malikii]